MKKVGVVVLICIMMATLALCACGGGHVHDAELEFHSAKSPTCTEAGNVEYYECKSCGARFDAAKDGKELENVTIAALGHDYEGAPYKADGANGHYRECVREGCDARSETEAHDTEDGGNCSKCGYSGQAAPHVHDEDLIFHKANDATCTEAGNVAYYECESCGACFEDADGETEIEDVTIDALGHDYEGAKYLIEDNGHYRNCTVCGERSETEAHTMQDGICSACGYADVEYEGTEGFVFRFDDGNGEHFADIQGYSGTETNIVLPETVLRGEVTYTMRAIMGNALKADGCVKLTSVTLSDNISAIGDDAFKGQDELEWIIIGNKMKFIHAAFDVDNGLTVYYKGTKYQYKEISFDEGNESFGTSNVGIFNATVYYYSAAQPIVPGNFWHFEGNNPVAYEPVEGVEEDVVGTEGLEYTYFDTDMTASVHYYSGEKTTVYVPEKVEHNNGKYTVNKIEASAFDYEYNGATLVDKVILPGTVTEIGDSAFYGQQLEYIILGSRIASIGNDAFGSESSSCAFREGGKIYFAGNEYVWEALIAFNFTGYTQLSQYVTAYCYSSVEPETAGKYWHYASDGTPLEWEEIAEEEPEPELYVTEGLTYDIDEDLEEATVTGYTGSENFVIIPNLTEKNMLSYMVTSIGEYAFEGMELDYVVFGTRITSIGEGAFYSENYEDPDYGKKLIIYYYGTEEQYLALTENIEGYINTLGGAGVKDYTDVYYYSKDEMTTGKYWHINADGLPEQWSSSGEQGPSGPSEPSEEQGGLIYEYFDDTATVTGYNGTSKNVVIPRTVEHNMILYVVTAIGDSAFSTYENAPIINTIIIPDSVETIGDYAFEGQDLEWIVIGSGVTSIGEDAFSEAFIEDDEGYGKFNIYYNGTSDDWNTLVTSFASWDNGFGGTRYESTVYFYSAQAQSEGNYWHYADEEQKTTPEIWQ